MSAFYSTNLFLFSRHHIPTNSIAQFSAYKLAQPTIYIIKLVDNTKLTHKDAKDAFLTAPLEIRVRSNESCAKVALRDLVTRFWS